MVDEGRFRLMPRVDAPFVRVCVLSVVGGTGVGKFWMFSLFSHLTVLQVYSYSSTARYGAAPLPKVTGTILAYLPSLFLVLHPSPRVERQKMV